MAQHLDLEFYDHFYEKGAYLKPMLGTGLGFVIVKNMWKCIVETPGWRAKQEQAVNSVSGSLLPRNNLF
ncbi:MAG: hypothetical protein E4H06_03350 [Methanosarcina sp.]|nr:MAG: hypothetical protein E4H06_03350 [Methanosarcina sp.]